MNTTLLALTLSFAMASHAEEPTAPHTSAEWQIWAYTTAAPLFIGKAAKVLDTNNEVLREGNNGWPSAHQAMRAFNSELINL